MKNLIILSILIVLVAVVSFKIGENAKHNEIEKRALKYIDDEEFSSEDKELIEIIIFGESQL